MVNRSSSGSQSEIMGVGEHSVGSNLPVVASKNGAV